MRKTLLFLLLALSSMGCSRTLPSPGITFHPSELSKTEQESLKAATGREWNNSGIFRAKWREGPPRDIVVQDVGLGGFQAHARIAVFFPNGSLEELTSVHTPEGFEPFRLLQPWLPLVVWFRDPKGERSDFFASATSAREMERFRLEMREALEGQISSSTNIQIIAALREALKSVQAEIEFAAAQQTNH